MRNIEASDAQPDQPRDLKRVGALPMHEAVDSSNDTRILEGDIHERFIDPGLARLSRDDFRGDSMKGLL